MTDEDWQVECSDDDCAEDYKPSTDKIIEWLERVCDEKELPSLECKIYPKRSNKAEEMEVDEKEEVEAEEKQEADEVVEKPPPPPPQPSDFDNEFDFDTEPSQPVKAFKVKKATERQPTKSVARMDQVCSNIVKYHKLDEKNQAAGDK